MSIDRPSPAGHYLERLGLAKSNYDKEPAVAIVGFDDQCWRGWDAIGRTLHAAVALRSSARTILAVECYSGVQEAEVFARLKPIFPNARFFPTAEAFKSPAEIAEMTAADLCGDDPVFGRLTCLTMADFLDNAKRESLRAHSATGLGLSVVAGSGALLCCDPDIIVFADMPRREAQLRQRNQTIGNLGLPGLGVKASLQYKRGFFIDWRVCDKLKQATMDRWDYLIDTCTTDDPKMISGEALRGGLRQVAHRPFRMKPFFDPGVWGGQWIREVCDIESAAPNYAWGFDCVPEENSLVLGFGDIPVEIPAINLVFLHPEDLLGEPVFGRFGAEFPIRFDFLDTMQGQNLSFQVHPDVDYAREHFGLSYTQDESYYILDAGPDASVYLGLADTVDAEKMMADLAMAQSAPGQPFPDADHVAKWSAKKHDHFLIPAGTCHCSGRNTMVLEISHTPYIFTFKLWDWARVDLDGLPRPINIERGREVIRWDRTRAWVGRHLINRVEIVAHGDGWREERTGLHGSQALETRRHWFTKTVPHDTRGESVHVLNLVEGAEAVVESPSNAFAPFIVHYAETFIVPAAVGPYTIRPGKPCQGKEIATIKALVRTNA